ncbi:MAG: hypothetical protein L0I94_11430 [Yaniella sp.]|uniref:hypothetical protein n=1 Tax=Yaniella sp. TaxID=2773929 RepID=UPI0026470386|nr:hypothetical protein [Yaniella sp.]MDN5732368.1 hypothetical protein [Yaniella sp.]MDN5816305.1 hypothetical protein [Yaniella sp.]MDN5890163.1 hypothetical protein [Yaniella sp.]MDN6149420.1 hypothetical protein [Yaniella sp.]MDN6151597.1 hypothetical protein [Yaniella sp.]
MKHTFQVIIASLVLAVALTGCDNETPNNDDEVAETVTVPDVLGFHPDTAGATLDHLDLTPVVRVDANSFDPKHLEVYATDPMPGATLEADESVWVCAVPIGENGGETSECPLPVSPDADAEVEEQFDKVDEENGE